MCYGVSQANIFSSLLLFQSRPFFYWRTLVILCTYMCNNTTDPVSMGTLNPRWRRSVVCWRLRPVSMGTLTCAQSGAVIRPPPLRFFADSEKTAARSAETFAIAVQPTICNIYKNLMTRWPQRSRLQVTLDDLTSSCIFQSLRASQRHINYPNSLKLPVCNTDIGI